jgi:hypothetical protein
VLAPFAVAAVSYAHAAALAAGYTAALAISVAIRSGNDVTRRNVAFRAAMGGGALALA